jgi:hypothetical protein
MCGEYGKKSKYKGHSNRSILQAWYVAVWAACRRKSEVSVRQKEFHLVPYVVQPCQFCYSAIQPLT